MKVEFVKKLALPDEIKKECPLSEKAVKTVADKKAEMEAIFRGDDNRKR